jgi:hypothetical protein
MAKKPTTTTDPIAPKEKKTRAPRKASYYVATIAGEDQPTIVIAKSFKVALAAIVSLKSATAADLIAAGKAGYPVVDTTAPLASVTDIAA